jgi:hypothetical protein
MVNFLQGGGSPARIITATLTGLVISPFIAIADVIAAIGSFFATPFTTVAESVGALGAAFFEQPADTIAAGFEVTESVLVTFLGESLAGILAGPIAVGTVLISLFLVVQFLQERETGDTIPGLPVDVPFVGVTEEGEEET